MRQVALISIMAQMGSFVPATQAELPILDRIFTRIGANDSLSQGLSTFMVEMSETAEMLSNATENSLVILDEVGRGTSTYDGMSLAQAILEHLQLNVKSLTLFATHYHELTAMESNFQNLKNVHMAIHEASGKILFQYTMKSGPADKSYGVEVAKLAGLPKSVVGRAAELLKQKESERLGRASTGAFGRVNDQSSKQLDLFEINESQQKLKLLEELTQKIKDFSVENHTPLQTAQVVQEWQKNLQ
jgi:DNA mismatch repair protein MutS